MNQQYASKNWGLHFWKKETKNASRIFPSLDGPKKFLIAWWSNFQLHQLPSRFRGQ